MSKRLTTQEFIARAREVHGDKYDYSKVNYINSDTKVCIICSVHGEFWQTPFHHLAGNSCKKCAMKTLQDNRRMTTERFIERVKEIHGDKYDYSKLHYCRPHEEVCIICPEHGEFWQRAAVHLYNGCGCPKCGDLSTKNLQIKSTEQFVQECKRVHGDKYDYSKAIYEGANNNIEIICPIHGSFWQRAKHHEEGVGCPLCGKEQAAQQRRLDTENVLNRFHEIHGNKYNYSKVEYRSIEEKVEIICPTHGSFFQTPYLHIRGSGCPMCRGSYGEQIIKEILDGNGVEYKFQYKIMLDLRLFGNNVFLLADFFLPKENLIIEFNGKQHYQEIRYFHQNKDDFLKQKRRDQKLREWCKDNNINLLEIKYDQIDNIKEILSNHINIDKYEKNYTQKTKNE